MDPKFFKWMADAMELTAMNMKFMDQSSGRQDDVPAAWLKMWQGVPGAPMAPYPPEAMESFYREWLAFFGAVPKKDYDKLKDKLKVLEAQRGPVEAAMDAVAQSMTGFKEVPEAMKPWMELMDKAAKAQKEFFTGLSKPVEKAADKGEGKGPEKAVSVSAKKKK